MNIATIFRHWFTSRGNENYEIMRALTALSVVVMLVYIGIHLVVNKQFAPLEAAGGLGALLFGGGAGAAIKDRGGLPVAPKVEVAGDATVEVK